jgi:hypothetical protein
MARVYRGLLHAGAWTATTAAAVTLSWFGVHSVLRSTAYDLPRALPITRSSGAADTEPPVASSTQRPRPSTPPPTPPASPTAPTPTPIRPGPPAGTTTVAVPPKTAPGSTHPTPPATTAPTGAVHNYTVHGGRVVLSLTSSAASLVTASPNTGWKMQVWTQSGWLRVTFTSSDGTDASSVICTWNGHPPAVQSYED